MILETTNEEILKELASSDNRYKDIKAYRLRIEAKKVSEYITNTKISLPNNNDSEKSLPIMKLQVVNVLYRQKKKKRLYKIEETTNNDIKVISKYKLFKR